MPKDPTSPRALAEAMRESVTQRLLRVARLVDERAIAEINREAGRPLLRPALTRVFPHIDFGGVRITELAIRLGVTKQAASQLVAELEAEGVVELLPDPEDGRARRVSWTRRGLEAMGHGLSVLGRIEGALATRIGRRRLRELGDTLDAIEDALSAVT